MRIIASCLIFLLLFSPVAYSLQTANLFNTIGEKAQKQTLPKKLEQPKPLEAPVNPEQYYVGPGDVFAITLWSEINSDITSTVTPEGTILIPTVGAVDLNGLNLKQAKEKITKAVLDRYKNTGVSVTLLNTRTFKVSVVGAVYYPGVYTASATDRVSTVIEEAGGLIGYVDKKNHTMISDYVVQSEKLQEKPTYRLLDDTLRAKPEKKSVRASKRRITLKRRNGEAIGVDLLKYERSGNLGANPYLLDGDVIVVPVMERKNNSCGIFGAVKAPGFFEFSEGDRISDLISLADGLNLDADPASGALIRFADDKITTIKIKLDIADILINPGSENDLLLEPDDRVFINAIQPFHDKWQVMVKGEVRFPGTYWLESDSVMLSDVLKQAGYFTPYADLSHAEMIRYAHRPKFDPEFERLKRVPISDMTRDEYDYFMLRSQELPGRVSLNLEKLIYENDKSYDICLWNEDVINIPRMEKTIAVKGQVANPGLINFVEGEDIDYYISRAGGLANRATKSKIRIIKGGTGEWVKPGKKHPLRPGDTVWVPQKPERDYWEIAKDVIMFAGNIATVYLVIKQAVKNK